MENSFANLCKLILLLSVLYAVCIGIRGCARMMTVEDCYSNHWNNCPAIK
jgi:hypothetical protein